MDDAWAAVVRILSANPWSAIDVVTAALWNDLPANVQTLILSADDPNDVCAAIAYARGMRDQPPRITKETARAFFAAVTPEIWDALPMKKKRTWLRRLSVANAHLAVRSLGPDPVFLAHAYLDKSLTTAVRRHAPDERTMRRILLPVAVRDLPLIAVPDIVGALLPPPDPVAFVHIAGRRREMPPALHDWITAHPMPQAMAAASTVLRAAARLATDPVADRCAALAAALAGWSREETDALLAALPDDAHAALHPNADALTDALAHPDRRDAFRQTLDTITALSPSVAIPALHALDALTQATKPVSQRQAGASLAQALRNHGNGFLALVDALADAPRTAILPQPRSAPRAVAVRAIAAADPLAAYRLAHALRKGKSDAVLNALMDAPFDTLTRIWRLLPETLQHAVLGDLDALLRDVAAPGRVDDLAQALQDWGADDPLPLLALRMLIGDSEERRAWGISALAQRPDVAAALLPLLRDDRRTMLASDPTIAFAGADLPPSRLSVHGRGRARRRR